MQCIRSSSGDQERIFHSLVIHNERRFQLNCTLAVVACMQHHFLNNVCIVSHAMNRTVFHLQRHKHECDDLRKRIHWRAGLWSTQFTLCMQSSASDFLSPLFRLQYALFTQAPNEASRRFTRTAIKNLHITRVTT